MLVDNLTVECWHLIGFYLGFGDVMNLLAVNRQIRLKITHNYFWQKILFMQFGKIYPSLVTSNIYDPLYTLRRIWKAIKARKGCNLAIDVFQASSIDRPEEDPRNVLMPSPCFQDMNTLEFRRLQARAPANGMYTAFHFQRRCGCAAENPCYWSSSPSLEPGVIEYLSFRLSSPCTCIFGFTITAYQAFFQPNSPIFAPHEVCIQFLLPSSPNVVTPPIKRRQDEELSENVYYQSEYFPMDSSAEQQEFLLPSPILYFCCAARILFRGMSQRQTLGYDEQYYLCISNVKILGIPFPMVKPAWQLIQSREVASSLHPNFALDTLRIESGTSENIRSSGDNSVFRVNVTPTSTRHTRSHSEEEMTEIQGFIPLKTSQNEFIKQFW